MRKPGFLMIEFLSSLAIVVILGSLFVLYRIYCVNISENTKRHLVAIDFGRGILESFLEDNKKNKKIEAPFYIDYSVKKNRYDQDSNKGTFVAVSVEWQDVKDAKHNIVLDTYYRDRGK